MKFQGRTVTFQRSLFRRQLAVGVWCLGGWSILLSNGVAENPVVRSLTVPILDVPASSDSTSQQPGGMRAATPDVQPTLPDGKLPQYQLTPRFQTVETEEQIENPKLRFLLALPAEPILIEASITIDGEPFRRKREQRVQATLQAALQPSGGPEEEPLNAERVEATSSVEASESKETVAEESADENPPEANTVESPALPGYQTASSVTEKLRRYVTTIGREVSLREVRWFFIQRVDGPTLLLLRENFQAFRADQTPVFHILDRNRDGVISSAEIAQAIQSFLDCDLNRNEVVDYLEISEAADDPRLGSERPIETASLLHLLPSEEDADETYAALLAASPVVREEHRSLPQRFDPNGNGHWEPEELEYLRAMPADITLHINFDSTFPEKSTLTIPETSLAQFDAQGISCAIINSSIVVSWPDCDLWFSAIQSRASDQISIGAVNDGYPMLPVLDPNGDNRFSLRELRGLPDALKQFDRNGDGQILKDELRPTIRVALGRGPHVHRTLADVRRVHSADSPAVAGPEWFVRMDRNKDGDLTRSEFPGTDDQFAQLDADGDGFVSAEEALKYDRQSSGSETETTTPKVNPGDLRQSDEQNRNNDN